MFVETWVVKNGGPELNADGSIVGTEGRSAYPHTMQGQRTEELTPCTVAYGLILAGYSNREVYNFLRCRYAEVPAHFKWYTVEVLESWCLKHRLHLVVTKKLTVAQYGRAALLA